jgi:L-seryl-tRNA(Ser) seleniumtransferase
VKQDPQALLRQIPRVDRVLLEPEVAALTERYGRAMVLEAVRQSTDDFRARALNGASKGERRKAKGESEGPPGRTTDDEPCDLLRMVCADVVWRVEQASRRSLRRAINATGVVLHTGLGRAVLCRAAADAVSEVARSHSLLEVDPESGERGSRLSHIAGLICELTGLGSDGDALVVNNNAAAVFLAISALAQGREVVISRGQLVEIGGSFRIPDVIRASGARLVEVGTTNKVRLSDYAEAITSETALLLRVHPSNFRIVGFTEEPSLAELAGLGRERGIPVMDDLGSGALVDLTRYGLVAEPTVHASVAAGADVVTFSGDKLLGGPQGGLVIGRKELVARMKRHPLMRVLRVDKMTMAGLEATLRLYRDEAAAMREIPTLAALTASVETLRARAEELARRLEPLVLEVELEPGISQVGGGALPGEELPTTLVMLRPAGISIGELARRLRVGEPSIWGRVQRDRLVFDLRTVRDEEIDQIAEAVQHAVLGEGLQIED